jgi:triacylglycerol lipase
MAHSGNYCQQHFLDSAEEILVALDALAGGYIDYVYDFDLQHWGIERKPGETLRAHIRRIVSTAGSTKDISSWDLSPRGARELNDKIRVFSDIYYMSYANASTFKTPLLGISLSQRLRINPALYLPADFMGTYFGDAIPKDQHRVWQTNDGIVNTVSMAGPDNSPIVKHRKGKPVEKGVWTYMGQVPETDHLQIVGHYLIDRVWLNRYYREIARRLAGLTR